MKEKEKKFHRFHENLCQQLEKIININSWEHGFERLSVELLDNRCKAELNTAPIERFTASLHDWS